ncbi:MAG: DUF5810 domain-containing protein [Halolamina sp.]
MGYACPVCDTPQRDGEHLANHLAFTAMLREDGHREWLDDTVPKWDEYGPEELADRVAGHALDAELDEVFEDTTGPDAGHDHAHHGDADLLGAGSGAAGAADVGVDDVDADAAEVVAEARELTEQMLGRAGDDGGDESGSGDEAEPEADDDVTESPPDERGEQ